MEAEIVPNIIYCIYSKSILGKLNFKFKHINIEFRGGIRI